MLTRVRACDGAHVRVCVFVSVCMCVCSCAWVCVCLAGARAGARNCVHACEGAHVPVCVSECVGAHTSALEGVRSRSYPPKLNDCGKLQIFILSVKKLENSSTHDFAQHISA